MIIYVYKHSFIAKSANIAAIGQIAIHFSSSTNDVTIGLRALCLCKKARNSRKFNNHSANKLKKPKKSIFGTQAYQTGRIGLLGSKKNMLSLGKQPQ